MITMLRLPWCMRLIQLYDSITSMKPEIKEANLEFDAKYTFADLGKTLNDMVLIQ